MVRGARASVKISIIIPTWNRSGLVADCLRTLEAQTFRDFEAVVVDDGSTDGTAECVARDFTWARLLRLPENRGFAQAVNAGIAEARGDWLFLLNNDMTLEPDCLERLLAGAEAANAHMAAPLVLWRDTPDVVYSAGDLQCANGRPESAGFRVPRAEFTAPPRVFGVSGGAGLIQRAVFERVGLLDTRFVAYFEDADLCFRARMAGYDAVFVGDAVAYHIGSASLAGRAWWRSVQCCRNHTLLVLKNFPAALLARHAGKVLRECAHQRRRCFSALRTDFGAARALVRTLAVDAALPGLLPHILRERRRAQARRVLTLAALDALLEREPRT